MIDDEKRDLILKYKNKEVSIVVNLGKPYYYSGKIIKVTDTSFIIDDYKDGEVLVDIPSLIQIKEKKGGHDAKR